GLDAPRPRLVLVRGRFAVVAAFGILVLTITGIELVGMFRGRRQAPHFLGEIYQRVAVFRSINTYGLFAVMTTFRPEIIVEGSSDGQTWDAYEFKYKPGD